jgi:hypothetical protein
LIHRLFRQYAPFHPLEVRKSQLLLSSACSVLASA